MNRESRSDAESYSDRAVERVPAGAPNWVTETLIDQTLQIWQPYYSYRLTREDALVIIKNVGRLFEVMSRGAEE
jgi:hypothetical protein